MMPNPAGLDQPERQVTPSVKSLRRYRPRPEVDLERRGGCTTASSHQRRHGYLRSWCGGGTRLAVRASGWRYHDRWRRVAVVPRGDRRAAAARDPPYGRALAVPRSLAEGRDGVGSGPGGYLERQLPPGESVPPRPRLRTCAAERAVRGSPCRTTSRLRSAWLASSAPVGPVAPVALTEGRAASLPARPTHRTARRGRTAARGRSRARRKRTGFPGHTASTRRPGTAGGTTSRGPGSPL
jgi:hypothetical protein